MQPADVSSVHDLAARLALSMPPADMRWSPAGDHCSMVYNSLHNPALDPTTELHQGVSKVSPGKST